MKKTPAVRESITPTVVADQVNVVTTATLRDVRENAERRRVDLNKTITELTELADEIRLTLAFLKAQRGDL